MQPGAALACLLTLGAGAGVWFWTLSQKNAPPPSVVLAGKTPPREAASDEAAPATVQAAAIIAEGIPGKQARLQELEKENAGLRKELARLRGADVSASPAEATPPGAEGVPGAAIQLPSPVTTIEQAATIRKIATGIENRIVELEGDNLLVRRQVADEMEAQKPPPTIDEVATRVVATRELAFRRTPAWTPSNAEEIVNRLSTAAVSIVKPEAASAREKAYVAMGFVRESEPFDYRDSLASLATMKVGGYYDGETGKFYYQADASLARADSRSVFAAALLPVLIAQNFPAAARQATDLDNDDEARALQAMQLGDAGFTRVRFSIGDQSNLSSDRGQAPAGTQQTPRGAQFVTDLWKWSEGAGSVFVQTIYQKGGLPSVNKAWQRVPRSSAEILHPETHYLAETPFVPVNVTFPDTAVNGAAPYFSNVAGEVAAYFLVQSYADVEVAATATEGWAGDRYLVWKGDPKHGDHVLWRTVWTSPEDGKQFFDAMRRILMQRFVIPWQKEYDAVADQFRVDDPHRIIHLVRNGATVTLVNATDPAIAKEMDAKFLK